VGEGQGGDEEGKQRWHVGDLLADERHSPAVLGYLRSTHAGRAAPPLEENWDSEDEAEDAEADEVEADELEEKAE